MKNMLNGMKRMLLKIKMKGIHEAHVEFSILLSLMFFILLALAETGYLIRVLNEHL